MDRLRSIAGTYNLILDESMLGDPFFLSGYVDYDDVALSTVGVNLDTCDDFVDPEPPMPTVSPTFEVTSTLQTSPTSSPQAIITITPQPTGTLRSTMTATTTARPTQSATAGPTPTRWTYWTAHRVRLTSTLHHQRLMARHMAHRYPIPLLADRSPILQYLDGTRMFHLDQAYLATTLPLATATILVIHYPLSDGWIMSFAVCFIRLVGNRHTVPPSQPLR